MNMKLIVAFRNFANAPKNTFLFPVIEVYGRPEQQVLCWPYAFYFSAVELIFESTKTSIK